MSDNPSKSFPLSAESRGFNDPLFGVFCPPPIQVFLAAENKTVDINDYLDPSRVKYVITGYKRQKR